MYTPTPGPAPSAAPPPATKGRSALPRRVRRLLGLAAALATGVGIFAPAAASAATPSSAPQVGVVVRETPGAGRLPQQVVTRLGGAIDRELAIINGFTATVPADRLNTLRATAGVVEVTANAALTLSDADVTGQVAQTGSLYTLANKVTGASTLWNTGASGQGVDIALVDSGVVPVQGLNTPGKVVYGPDLTAEAATPAANLDLYGHGTNMAGIIAGRDTATTVPYGGNSTDFVGMAPDARIVSIKIADAQGHTDVSQALAAIDWAVENGHKHGLNIRVLNLSFGTDSAQPYALDPLAFAVEQAWRSGIVVVVAAGNSGNTSPRLNNPATDPYVIAVGSDNANGTASTADDAISSFSSSGDGTRNPDLVAPGEHVVSLRDPGAYLDASYPAARIGDRLFRGSGTSQAAAVVSGAAALLISQRPDLSPDQVKSLLTGTAQPVPGATASLQGNGLLDLTAAAAAATPAPVTQHWRPSTGLGSLEAARGSVHLTIDGKQVTGEVDVRGHAFDAAAVAAGIRNHANWTGISWTGISWSGISWSGISWSGISWSGISWSGISWSGISWSGISWSGISWSGISWSTADWT